MGLPFLNIQDGVQDGRQNLILHIFGHNWDRATLFGSNCRFSRSKNSNMTLFFMSLDPNSRWPPKSKMATKKLIQISSVIIGVDLHFFGVIIGFWGQRFQI